MSRNALLKGFGGGISSRLSYLTSLLRFLVALAVISIRLPGRDDAYTFTAFSENESDYLAIIFTQRDEPPLAVIVPGILVDQDETAENLSRLAKADVVLAPVDRVLGIIPLEANVT